MKLLFSAIRAAVGRFLEPPRKEPQAREHEFFSKTACATDGRNKSVETVTQDTPRSRAPRRSAETAL